MAKERDVELAGKERLAVLTNGVDLWRMHRAHGGEA